MTKLPKMQVENKFPAEQYLVRRKYMNNVKIEALLLCGLTAQQVNGAALLIYYKNYKII